MSLESIIKELEKSGYTVRLLPDGSIAGKHKLMFTTAIYLGMTRDSWETRFCFQNPSEANKQFLALKSEDDELTGWVARRPELKR